METATSLDEQSLEILKRTKASILFSNSQLENLSVMMRKDLKHSFELKKVYLSNALSNLNFQLNELFPKKNIKLDIQYLHAGRYILADDLFEHLLLNILTNCVKNDKYEEIIINISFECELDNICKLVITNHGRGIPPEERENVFNRYSLLGKKSGGTGLGFFIIKTLVERYNAKFSIESRVKDDYKQGTKFVLEFGKQEQNEKC